MKKIKKYKKVNISHMNSNKCKLKNRMIKNQMKIIKIIMSQDQVITTKKATKSRLEILIRTGRNIFLGLFIQKI